MFRRAGHRALAALLAAVALAGCADFSAAPPTFTNQPRLTAVAPEPQIPGLPDAAPSGPPSTPGAPTGEPGRTPPPADPCRPADPAVIAACLTAPWGLIVLPDGSTGLVGERTTGRVLRIARGQEPTVLTTITGIDATGSGGLLGLALSPGYVEDGLIFAYITTATDNRIVRFAPGQPSKVIFSGIPKGRTDNGGRIMFASDGLLYVGTGDAGDPDAAASPASLAGKVLRLTEFGKPAPGNPRAGSPVFAAGFTDVRGMCLLPGNRVGALDHRGSTDVLIPVAAGTDYRSPAPGQSLWTWAPGGGGAVDCAVAAGTLATTSLDKPGLTGLLFSGQNAFTGSPTQLLDGRYGRLLTVSAGGPTRQPVFWMTTSNKDGQGKPTPSDDRVVALPAGGAGAGGLD